MLSDDKLKAAIEKGFKDAGYAVVRQNTEFLFNAIREAERKHDDQEWPRLGPLTDVLPPDPTQAYADKVLEVAVPVLAGMVSCSNPIAWEGKRLEKISDFCGVAIGFAETLITAAHDAAMKRKE